MARSLLIRGMLVGIAAGFAAFLVARIFGESAVAQAIALEGAAAHAHAGVEAVAEEPELVSRGTQSGIGLLTAALIYGVGLGGIFALVFAFTQGRLGRFTARGLSAVLALGGFVALSLVPLLKYPANPPAVGNGDTIGRRTALYFTLIVISLAIAVLAVWLGRALAPRFGNWDATITAAAFFVVAIGLSQWALPSINEVGEDYPATTLWHFRLASLGVQAAVWATLGLLFGALTERSLRESPVRTSAKVAVPAG